MEMTPEEAAAVERGNSGGGYVKLNGTNAISVSGEYFHYGNKRQYRQQTVAARLAAEVARRRR